MTSQRRCYALLVVCHGSGIEAAMNGLDHGRPQCAVRRGW